MNQPLRPFWALCVPVVLTASACSDAAPHACSDSAPYAYREENGIAIDLIARAEADTELGVWRAPKGVTIGEVRLGKSVKRCFVVPSGTPLVLPAISGEQGVEVHFAYTTAGGKGRRRAASRIRVDGILGEGAGASTVTLFETPVVPAAGGYGNDVWSAASFSLPDLGVESICLSMQVLGTDSEKAKGVAIAFADLVMLAPPVEDDRPNVLLISLDTLRADRLPFYGYDKDTAPFLSTLTDKMVVYENAYTPSTWTLPSHGSVFTGLYPSQHKAITQAGDLRGQPLPRESLTLAEVLRQNDYVTLGVVAGPMLRPRFGVDQGFVFYSAYLRRAPALTDYAIDWLDRIGKRPFFLFLNYFDVHLPVDPPGYGDADHALFEKHDIDISHFQWEEGSNSKDLPEEVIDAIRARYDAEIRYLDQALKQLFDQMEERGLLENTIVCFFGDHGESFGEHGQFGHGGAFHDDQAHVPYMYIDPRKPESAGRVSPPTSTIEIPGRILADLGLSSVPGFEFENRPVYGARFGARGSNRMYSDGRYKYMVNFTVINGQLRRHEKLFDLQNDPEEAQDLFKSDPTRAAALREAFDAFVAESGVASGEATAVQDVVDAVTEEELELRDRLRAMGYVE